MDREKVGKAGMSGTVFLTLVSCPFFDAQNDQRKRRVNSRENEKDDGKLALARRVVAKETN